MVEKICLILLVVLAVFSIMSVSLRRAVIYMAIYSLLCSFVYLVYRAPDVAIAEASIGTAFTTIIYWVGIKRQKVIRIYYLPCVLNGEKLESCEYSQVYKVMEQFLKKKELEPLIINSESSLEEIRENELYDYIFQAVDDEIVLYGREEDHRLDELEKILNEKNNMNAIVYRIKEKVEE